jgi:hypothetical protein
MLEIAGFSITGAPVHADLIAPCIQDDHDLQGGCVWPFL